MGVLSVKLSLNLENCYGIEKLEHEFNFINGKPIIIHSSNGTMKTSLCKTFNDIVKDLTTRDQIHTSKITLRDIKLNGNNAISSDIRVFNSYEDGN